MDPAVLQQKLAEREREDRLRWLQPVPGGIDFYSNDYLGIVRNAALEKVIPGSSLAHGSTGSRLLGGNHPLAAETERMIAAFHNSPAALLFNSGYDANMGLLSCVAGRADTILYDQLSHASLRDGVRLSMASSFSFAHNDIADLERLLRKATGHCYVVTESVFSMDGDQAPLEAMAALCEKFNAFLIVDEAHATGVLGQRGTGLVQAIGIQEKCFARVHTFGKALGCHGAVVLGSDTLRNYLVNFCRPFIYSTALPPVSLQAIRTSYELFPRMDEERIRLLSLISQFTREISRISSRTLPDNLAVPGSPIQAVVIPGNTRVQQISQRLRGRGLAVYPVFSPTVKAGTERLRIILHAYNSSEEVAFLIDEIGSAIS